VEQRIFELLNYCYSDSLVDEIGKLNYQLFVMSLKSMLPYENKIGCKFDEARYLDEIKTLRYYINGNDEVICTVIDIDDDGELIVKHKDGTVNRVISGEVSVRGIYGYV